MRKLWLLIFPVMFYFGPAGEATNPPAAENEKASKLDPDPHLMGWWTFDDVSGKTVKDSSKHGRDGALQGGLSLKDNSVPGRVGRALQFDGKDNLVEITGYKGVSGTKSRTITAWIKTKTSRGEILSWGSEDFGKMWTLCFIRGRLGVTPRGGYYYMNAEVHDDSWHHVAVVVEDAERPNLHDHVKLYKDGEIAEVHDIGLLDLWPVDTGSDLDVRIGRRFQGCIDDLRIYNRAFTEDDIEALYKSYRKDTKTK